MYPDYTNVTIPKNIAPLNFLVRQQAEATCLLVNGKVLASSRDNAVSIDDPRLIAERKVREEEERKKAVAVKLETFITAGEMEVKAWTYRRGWKAPQCAGVIHTDFEKGFIRAEVIKYDDYVRLGSEAAVRDAGLLHVEGKEYVVQDGDIMHFRFNV